MSEIAAEITPLEPKPGPCLHEFFVNVTVTASPGTKVQAGMSVQLTGTAQGVEVLKDCAEKHTPVPFSWSLSFQPPGGNETDITSSLQNARKLNPFFIANSEGTYRARLTAGNAKFGTDTAEVVITAAPPPPVPLHVSGHVTSLLVQNVGGGFGPENDFIDVDVVTQLDTQPDKSFGFQLRNDKNRPARQGMFDLLRDAFDNNWTVTLDGSIVPGKNNGLIIRTTVTK